MTSFEAKILYTIDDCLEDMCNISFCTKSPNYIAYTNRKSLFNFCNLKPSQPQKLSRQLETIASCLCLADVSCATVGLDNGSIEILDLNINKSILNFKAHESKLLSVNLTPFSRLILTSSIDSTVKIWDYRQKKVIRQIRWHEPIVSNNTYLSPDQTWIVASISDGTTVIYDIKAAKVLETLSNTGPASLINFHPHEKSMSTCSTQGHLTFWDLTSFSPTSSLNLDELPLCTFFHATSLSLFVGSQSGKILNADWESNEFHECVLLESSIYDMSQSVDKFYFISGVNEYASVIETSFDIFSKCNLSFYSSAILSSITSGITSGISNSIHVPSTTTLLNQTYDVTHNTNIYSNAKPLSNSLLSTTHIDSHIDPILHSTKIDDNVFDVKRCMDIFHRSHKVLMERAGKRIRCHESIARGLRIRNFQSAIKAAEDCGEPPLVAALVKLLVRNVNNVRDLPPRSVLKLLRILLGHREYFAVVVEQICLLLKVVKLDSSVKNELLEISKALDKMLDKSKEMDNDHELLRLLVNKYKI